MITTTGENLPFHNHPKVYIWGKSGIGKTWTIRRSLDKYIDMDYDVLKSKQSTLQFIERIKVSRLPVLIDDYDSVCDTIGMKEIHTLDRVIIIGNSPAKMDGFVIYEFPVKTHDELTEIAAVYGVTDPEIIQKSQGDIRYFITPMSDDKDVFWTPKDFVSSMICVGGNQKPGEYIGQMIQEHGHVMDMIFDNYIDSEADPCDVLECLSRAAVYDEVIYNGRWDLLPYFSIEACVYPSHYINHTVRGNIRPGSMWTKFSNMCMRRKKFRQLATRVVRHNLDVDAVMLFRDYFEKGQGHHLIDEYNLHKSDIDVINHLCMQRKLKPSIITALKKRCLELHG
jgi:hypothetical protein